MNLFREKFRIPTRNGKEQIYFLGNSLGLQPITTASAIHEVLEQWAYNGVEAFFEGTNPWKDFHNDLCKPLANITGALPSEIVVMNHLTVNLHLLLASFYKPQGKRFKIICEAKAFPSDQYMLETHVRFHGYHPAETIIEVHPREGEDHIRMEDIAEMIDKNASELALVLWGGVNYLTGQLFDIAQITQCAHNAGALAGFDLAHAAGNVKLELHDWNVDFACWCSYKYLNSGPGAVAGSFIHERYHNDSSIKRLAGWWGYDKETRFLMQKGFKPVQSAEGWQVSTPPILLLAAHKASLDIFEEAGMDNLVKRGRQLGDELIGLMRVLIEELRLNRIEIVTPSSRGCQISIRIHKNAKQIFEQLKENGIFADWREPDIIRVAPVPLYNTSEEVIAFSQVMKKILS